MLRARVGSLGFIRTTLPRVRDPSTSRVPLARRTLTVTCPVHGRRGKSKRSVPAASSKSRQERDSDRKETKRSMPENQTPKKTRTANGEHLTHESPTDTPIVFPDSFSPLEFEDVAESHAQAVPASSPTQKGPWMSLAERLQHGSVSQSHPLSHTSGHPSPPEASTLEHTESDPESISADLAPPKLAQPKKSTKSKPAADEKKQPTSDKSSSVTGAEESGKKPRKKKATDSEVVVLWPNKIRNKPVETDAELDVPKLQHNLDRVLFNPGVHVMRDARSRVYNFDPDIATIMPADEFDYDALGEYITSSKDEKLRGLCAKYNKKYCGSTSSLSSILSHFHYLLSAWRKPNFKQLSRDIRPDSENFTQILRSPAAAFAHYRDGSYAIDADKEYDVDNILSSLGKSMEKHLLLPKEEYEKYRLTRSHEIPQEQKDAGESYHYSELGDFLVRSQLDAYDPRLPGTGVFDLKTRAVVSIRMDVQGYEKGTDYEINQLHGQWDSFEREYMDMIRAAFLKYSLQVRMGRMDGIFCAYHNTRRIFGFQYIPLEEMDYALHGVKNTRLGDEEFKASLKILNELLDKGAQRWPERTLRLHVETRDTAIPLMYFFIQPVTDAQMEEMQSANRSSAAASAAKVVKSLKNLEQTLDETEAVKRQKEQEQTEAPNSALTSDLGEKADDASRQTVDRDEVWEELEARVEDLVENDSNGLEFVRAAVVDAMKRHGLLEGKSEAEVQGSISTLVEALVGTRADWKADALDSQEKTVENDEAAESGEPSELESSNSNGASAYDTPDSATSILSAEEVPASSAGSETPVRVEEDVHSEAIEATTVAAVEADASTEHEAATSGLGLKELIFRATEHAERQSSDSRAFDRIIAELSAGAKARDDQKDPQVEQHDGDMTKDTAQSIQAESEPDTGDSESPSEVKSEPASDGEGSSGELLGMVITVRNKVDGKMVDRPHGTYKTWSVGYSVTELESEKAWKVYRQLKGRRSNALKTDPDKRHRSWYTMFDGNLKKATSRGKLMRETLEKEDKDAQTVKVAWDEAPQPRKLDPQAD